MLTRLLPPIRIHIWGGLGSQLYAWALYIDLLEHFPHRKVNLVFHNGGVTRRNPDIAHFFHSDSVGVVRDFDRQSHEEVVKRPRFQVRKLGRAVASRVLTFSGFLSSCEEVDSIESLKPWVLEIRGHYSYRKIKHSTVNEIYQQLIGACEVDSPRAYIGVHDRLGDLMSLDSKGPTPVEALTTEIRKAIQQNPKLSVKVFSDSIEDAQKRLELLSGFSEFEYIDVDPTLTIHSLVRSEFFVGTSSKISLWVVIFRNSAFRGKKSAMPSNLQMNLISNIGIIETISYY
jgi:hypothetical protein